jgi:hypothetical protein
MERGRAVYEEAVQLGTDLARGHNDYIMVSTRWTYLQWAVSEKNTGGANADVQRLLDLAEHRFEQVIYRPHREDALRALNALRDQPSQPAHDAAP